MSVSPSSPHFSTVSRSTPTRWPWHSRTPRVARSLWTSCVCVRGWPTSSRIADGVAGPARVPRRSRVKNMDCACRARVAAAQPRRRRRRVVRGTTRVASTDADSNRSVCAGSRLEVRMPMADTIRRATSAALGVVLATQMSQQPSVGAAVDASAGTTPYLVISIQNLSPAGPGGAEASPSWALSPDAIAAPTVGAGSAEFADLCAVSAGGARVSAGHPRSVARRRTTDLA